MRHPECWLDATRARRRFLRSGAGLLLLAAGSAIAQARFPARPVRIIVPFPPGQAADTAARMLAQKLTAIWGQQVVVDNRGGGLGIPAMVAAKSAPADGYTLAMGTTQTLCVNPALRRNLPYDLTNDFTPVSGVVSTPLLLIAHPGFPARTVRELVALAQKSATPLQFASPGIGTSQHLTGEWFAVRAGIKLQHIAYKGSAPAITDVIGGQVPLMVDSTVSALPHIKADAVRAIAVSTKARIPQLPQVPTVAESGYPDFDSVGIAGLVAPSGTPAQIVSAISADVRRALDDPRVHGDFLERGGLPSASSPQEFGAFLQAETAKWTNLVKQAQIKLED